MQVSKGKFETATGELCAAVRAGMMLEGSQQRATGIHSAVVELEGGPRIAITTVAVQVIVLLMSVSNPCYIRTWTSTPLLQQIAAQMTTPRYQPTHAHGTACFIRAHKPTATKPFALDESSDEFKSCTRCCIRDAIN